MEVSTWWDIVEQARTAVGDRADDRDAPGTLADLPVIASMSRDEGGWIGYESLGHSIRDAYRRVQGETDTFDTALETAVKSMTRPEQPSGDNWDPQDDAPMRHHLPRLAALFLD